MKIKFKRGVFLGLFLCLSLLSTTTAKVYAATPSIGSNYTSYLDQTPVNSKLGTATRVSYSAVKQVEKEVCNSITWSWKDRLKMYDDIFVVIYKFSNYANLIVEQKMNEYKYLTAGSTYTYTITREKGTIINYTKSATTELTSTYGASAEAEVDGLNFGKIKASAYTEVESKMSETYTRSSTYTYSTTITEQFVLKAPSSAYYRLQTRGLFTAYVIQVYQANYTSSKTHHGLPGILGYDTWTYTLKNYTLKEQLVDYSYRNDTLVNGFFKYGYSNGGYIFADTKESGIYYL